MSQHERTKRHKENHPQSESRRKEQQRNKEAVCLFHIKRFMISGIEIPKSIDQSSTAYERALGIYEELRGQKVEMEILPCH